MFGSVNCVTVLIFLVQVCDDESGVVKNTQTRVEEEIDNHFEEKVWEIFKFLDNIHWKMTWNIQVINQMVGQYCFTVICGGICDEHYIVLVSGKRDWVLEV